MELFRRQWEIYEKFVTHDYLSSMQAYGHLHRRLMDMAARPFRFLDLACGDARGIVEALKGTRVAHYHGVDLAPPALDMARTNLEALPCEVVLEHGDFIEAMRERPEPADVVWIGLSLHHLDTPGKLDFMGEIRAMIDAEGLFFIYEPTRNDGEDRDSFLDRFDRTGRRLWTAFTPHEWATTLSHVRTADLPETASGWLALGRAAGFATAEEVFKDPTDLLRMFCYRP